MAVTFHRTQLEQITRLVREPDLELPAYREWMGGGGLWLLSLPGRLGFLWYARGRSWSEAEADLTRFGVLDMAYSVPYRELPAIAQAVRSGQMPLFFPSRERARRRAEWELEAFLQTEGELEVSSLWFLLPPLPIEAESDQEAVERLLSSIEGA